MANLPIEMWHFIFDRLELVDISSCAQVCKTVYSAVKSYRIREIAFTRGVHEWFHYTKPIANHKHRVHFMEASILKRSSFDFDYLKRLKIGRRSAFDLDVINRFTRLEELDIDLGVINEFTTFDILYNLANPKNPENEQSRTLSLANLKVLYLFMPDHHLWYLELDTPCLAKVCAFSLKRLEFLYPESVRCINTFYHWGKLSMFPNLEYLAFIDFYEDDRRITNGMFKDFNWRALKKLKEVDFYYLSTYETGMSNFKKITANLLGRPDLKVFWSQVQMTNPSLLNEYERMAMDQTVGSILAFQLQHYEKLKEKVELFWHFEFNSSLKKLSEAGFNPRSEEFKSKFLAKYSFRKIVITGQVEEQEFLLELIARSPDLFALKFKNSGLGQSFFDLMADIVQLNTIPLKQLQVEGTLNESLNFEFLFKLRYLERLEIDQELSDEVCRNCRNILGSNLYLERRNQARGSVGFLFSHEF